MKQFGEDKVGLIPNGVELLLNKTGLGAPVPSVIDDYTLERNFLIQPEEFEKNGIVPISLDIEKTLDDMVPQQQNFITFFEKNEKFLKKA